MVLLVWCVCVCTAKAALEARLVDGLLYKEGVKDRLAELLGVAVEESHSTAAGQGKSAKLQRMFLRVYGSKRGA